MAQHANKENLCNEIKLQEELISERDDAISKIESEILAVNEMFRDVNTLVQIQGELVDNIEYYIHESKTNVDEGVKQLEKAEKHQSIFGRYIMKLVRLGK